MSHTWWTNLPATGDTKPGAGVTCDRELWVLCCDNTVLCDLSEPGDNTCRVINGCSVILHDQVGQAISMVKWNRLKQ